MFSLYTMSIPSFTGRQEASDDAPCDHVNRVSPTPPKRINGGAYRDRTDDLLNANQALSQLS
jgi:hypothetical protein